MVEWDRKAKKAVDDVRIIVQLLVNHEGKDTHLGSTTIVQFDGQLLVNGGLIPTRCLELSGFDVIFAGGITKFNQTNEGNDLSNTSSWDGFKSSKTILDRGERNTVGDFTRKTNTSSGNNVAKDGKLGDAAVFGLNLQYNTKES